jgi:hypothetical protein
MINFRIATMIAGVVLPLLSVPAHAYDDRILRYGNTSPWSYDGRDDKRDFPTNGFFPGNFVTDPSSAWIGAGGFLSSNPQRSILPYPSQVVFGPCPGHRSSAVQNTCRDRSWPRAHRRRTARK